MKKIIPYLILSVLCVNTTWAENLQKSEKNLPESIMSHVIERDLLQLEHSIRALQTALQSTENERTQQVDHTFTRFITHWKSVQTIYIAGELDTDLIDTPRLIDAYHNGKEELITQLDRALKKSDSAKVALFKNTFKSVNALAYFLYADNNLSSKEKEYALHTIKTLEKHVSEISASYKKNRVKFFEDQDIFMSFTLNALIDSSYKLKEWRVGDPSGLSRKYRNTPDSRRQEYPYSKKSLQAIRAILAIHADVMGERPYTNLGSIAIEQGAIEETDQIRKLISTAQQQNNALMKNKVNLDNTTSIQPLFITLAKLNDAYYQSLVKALPVQARILDADGD